MRAGALLLAAGRSSRFEDGHKLLAEHAGEPVVVHAARALAQAGLAPVIVLGAEADAVREAITRALPAARATMVVNERFAEGMGGSIACGMRALAADADAVLIALGDMPLVGAREVRLVLDAHDAADPRAVTRAVGGGRPGHPTLLGRSWFDALGRLEGDRGAAAILGNTPFRAVPVEPRTQADVDTREALAALQRCAHG